LGEALQTRRQRGTGMFGGGFAPGVEFSFASREPYST